ncbi:MAG: hypothetical protein ACI33S_00645 [Bacilli bacterium]
MKLTLLDSENEYDKKYINHCGETQAAKISGLGSDSKNENDLYYLKTADGYGNVMCADIQGICIKNSRADKSIGIRPVMEEIENFDEITKNKYLNEDGEYEVLYGLYPYSLPNEYIFEKLTELMEENKLNKVGKNSFSDIYEYKGKFYIQIKSFYDIKIDNEEKRKKISKNNIVWLELKPVKWLVDEAGKRLISKDIIISGIAFDKIINDYTHEYQDYRGYFEITNMYRYLNKVMLKDLTCKITYRIDYSDMYRINNDQINEKDVIKFLILNGIFVGLTGNASIEKNEILSSIDPNYKSYESYNNLPDLADFKAKCINETDKMHILNVNSQAYYYEHTGKEIGSHIKTIIDFMGDVKNYCLTSTFDARMNEDMFINIEVKRNIPTLIEKLNSKEKLHPLIYSLILYLGGDRVEALTTQKKLLIASVMLEKTCNLNYIRHIIGDELTNVIEQLIKEKTISIYDIVDRNYKDDIFDMNDEMKALLIPYLALVDENHVEIVRNFIIRLDSSLIYIFDYLWSYNNQDREKIIDELSKTNNQMTLRIRR